ncbi:4-hydroxythreonine-4-phosphate dehydrogenase PdxA [Candidatus Pelagibacter sp. Uisw_134_02]|uniref:4-hydroxythreonine-4-phosphate dehydrogenase PdxA n=1 Tax=Candidatus Pelagibacter sp. Uisw_134_02 TaxID=3230990 RepID=UPI0039EA5769
MSKNFKPTLVVAGEPYSIFTEIFFKALKNKKVQNEIILIISKKLLIAHMKFFKYNLKINTINKDIFNLNKIKKNEINIIDVKFNFRKNFDKISSKSNIYIKKSFELALDLLKTNNFSGLINGPISKKDFLKGKILGITEYLSKKTNNKDNTVMLIYNKKLAVSPLTTHLPLKSVYKKITRKKIINHVQLINKFYKKRFNKKPKIAITGLNPHCESNFKNSEEETIIKPTIKNLKKKNFSIDGPFPADTIFMRGNLRKFDVIIGMYHDQVLTPMKSLFEFDAINITLGLPFVRISPDHGPNTAMLGKNLSNPKSLIEALKFLNN